jgi:hypothetical protein
MNSTLRLETWKEAKEYFLLTYGRAGNKSLRGGGSKEQGSHSFTLVCDGCVGFLLVVRKRGDTFQLIEEMSRLEHEELCIGSYTPTAEQVFNYPIFAPLRNSQSNNKRSGLSTETMQSALCAAGMPNASIGVIKKAALQFGIKPLEHIQSMVELEAYLEKAKQRNPTLAYSLTKNPATRVFHRLSVLFPGSAAHLACCYRAVGLDSAHMDAVMLEGVTKAQINTACGTEGFERAGRQVMQQLTLSVVAGRTLNNEMIVFGYCLGYSECMGDLKAFLSFLLAEGLDLNADDMTILTDRGTALIPAVTEILPKTYHLFCPKHLERNLQAKKVSEVVRAKYWQARSAVTETQYREHMYREMTALSDKGREIAVYLESIANWQLYKVIASGNVVYEMKSDNLVEGVFSWCKEERSLGSAFFFTQAIFMTNAQRLVDLRATATKAEASRSRITPFAYAIFDHTRINTNAAHYTVLVQRQEPPKGLVTNAVGNSARQRTYNVDFLLMICDCRHWEQSGVPCLHAVLLFHRVYPSQPMPAKYFYEWCHIDRLKSMFTTDDYMINIPDVDAVASLVYANADRYKLYPLIISDDTSSKSSKRIRSTGEGSSSGGQSKASLGRKQKRPCDGCGKLISGNTLVNGKHKLSACVKYAVANGTGNRSSNTAIIMPVCLCQCTVCLCVV